MASSLALIAIFAMQAGEIGPVNMNDVVHPHHNPRGDRSALAYYPPMVVVVVVVGGSIWIGVWISVWIGVNLFDTLFGIGLSLLYELRLLCLLCLLCLRGGRPNAHEILYQGWW